MKPDKPSNGQTRVLIAEGLRLLGEGCKSLLESECGDVRVVVDVGGLRSELATLPPDILILDARLPGLSALDFLRRLPQKQPRMNCILLSTSETANSAAEAFRRGASAYILKQNSGQDLLLAVRRVSDGKRYLSPLVSEQTVSRLLQQKANVVTTRQYEILELLAQGHSMVAIGHILKVTSKTVAFHKYRMMKQLGVTTNAALLKYAMSSR